MKRNEMTLKEFCMRYPIKEVVLKPENPEDEHSNLIESEVYSRSLIYKRFGENAKISFNELSIKEESEYLLQVELKQKNNNIFAMLDVEIDGQKCYGENDILSDLTKKEYVELASSLRNFKEGLIIM
ncbi:hypothetical protein GQX59_08730 [Brachyspira hyodysenteriae]|uniref:hypothetical protein n=1 Tax=Brachyspira hyodysenteriae TaxID=159 RepID=UPI00063D9303|nr:hypothetical protein [Brachyspira hyodysenteriae]KLI16434.1 hypothetical protein SU45_07520 [Brachyspira hyodysenteriae]KLI59543.1 hypothetical protein SZ44_08250 [Brachyspira hyodysenteriae]KLI62233.1 hypothetical protein SZ46_02650 [Brachyspira hyodysenteriae]QTM11508.1 hypothetical protein GQX59_08730 [Brachyspira hyodysenteriae]